jgi:hypothetical protein
MNQLLMEKLPRQSSDRFVIFCDCLRKAGQAHLANLLEYGEEHPDGSSNNFVSQVVTSLQTSTPVSDADSRPIKEVHMGFHCLYFTVHVGFRSTYHDDSQSMQGYGSFARSLHQFSRKNKRQEVPICRGMVCFAQYLKTPYDRRGQEGPTTLLENLQV